MLIQRQINQLHCQINNKTILNNVTVTVSKGEVIGIIGPYGAGKTNLLPCITNQQHTNKSAVFASTVHLKNKIIKNIVC